MHYLHERSPIRIAAGEWQNTRFEFLDLADRGQLDVLQPDVGRVGGFTEAMRVCRIAADRNRLIVPHCWKSGIGIAASAHLAAACDCCPYIEFLPIGACRVSAAPRAVDSGSAGCRRPDLTPELPRASASSSTDEYAREVSAGRLTACFAWRSMPSSAAGSRT